jgi:hypothetical protein
MKSKLLIGGLATGFAVATLAIPVGAGESGLSISGEATCNLETGHETWGLEWSLTNIGPASNIDSAIESGAWDGSVTVEPNPIPANSSGSGSDGPVPNGNVGTVTLTVNYTQNGQEKSAVGTIHLDGSCGTVSPSSLTPLDSTTTTYGGTSGATATPTFTG